MDVHVPFIFSHLQVEEKKYIYIYIYKNHLYIYIYYRNKKFTINIVISLCLGLLIVSLFSLSLCYRGEETSGGKPATTNDHLTSVYVAPCILLFNKRL